MIGRCLMFRSHKTRLRVGVEKGQVDGWVDFACCNPNILEPSALRGAYVLSRLKQAVDFVIEHKMTPLWVSYVHPARTG